MKRRAVRVMPWLVLLAVWVYLIVVVLAAPGSVLR